MRGRLFVLPLVLPCDLPAATSLQLRRKLSELKARFCWLTFPQAWRPAERLVPLQLYHAVPHECGVSPLCEESQSERRKCTARRRRYFSCSHKSPSPVLPLLKEFLENATWEWEVWIH